MEVEDNKDFNPFDDSFKNTSYEPNHETIEDENRDDLEQKCDFCGYQTFWDNQMKQHREWKHSTLLRQAQEKNKLKAPNSKGLESGRRCDTCGENIWAKVEPEKAYRED